MPITNFKFKQDYPIKREVLPYIELHVMWQDINVRLIYFQSALFKLKSEQETIIIEKDPTTFQQI